MKTLYEDKGRPYIAIAGEVHNSNGSSPEYMESVWKVADELGMNTLLIPVSWEIVEPEEDVFDWKVVDELIDQGRAYNKKIVFLWFGTWKNAQCMYAPEWVKKDTDRFLRAQIEKGYNKVFLKNFFGMSYSSLSYFGEETCKADAKAFKAFMKHLKEYDEEQHTVIGIQVENETGVQGAAREHSDYADMMFEKDVPQGLIDYLRNHIDTLNPKIKNALEVGKGQGSWSEVFGGEGEEVFSAYYIASYVEKVAKAGREAYYLPYTVNCWIDKGDEPGFYPSGGPIDKMMEIWHYAAPSIDAIGPDIYSKDFYDKCCAYKKCGNKLVIPETAIHSYSVDRLVYSIGEYHASCFAPFGFENMGEPFTDFQAILFGIDINDPLLQTPQDPEIYGSAGKLLCSMMDIIAEKYDTDDLRAVVSELDQQKTLTFEPFQIEISMSAKEGALENGVCLVLKSEEDTFYILGNGCDLRFSSTDNENPNCDILKMEEGKFEDSVWIPGRRLNGDEISNVKLDKFQILKIKLYNYKN